jgi:hypothetical protein
MFYGSHRISIGRFGLTRGFVDTFAGTLALMLSESLTVAGVRDNSSAFQKKALSWCDHELILMKATELAFVIDCRAQWLIC